MTNAALGAMTLQKTLCEQRLRFPDQSLSGLSRRFQKRLAKLNETLWMLATTQDYQYRETVGGSALFRPPVLFRVLAQGGDVMKRRTEITFEMERWIVVKRRNETGCQDFQDLQDDPVNPEHPVLVSDETDIIQYHSYFSRSHQPKRS